MRTCEPKEACPVVSSGGTRTDVKLTSAGTVFALSVPLPVGQVVRRRDLPQDRGEGRTTVQEFTPGLFHVKTLGWEGNRFSSEAVSLRKMRQLMGKARVDWLCFCRIGCVVKVSKESRL